MVPFETIRGLPSEPDIMNDPAYETNSREKEKGVEEPDTCRICRGEGSKEEPLFYPCKCSGSIKFVHQGCLMEWLSHSQKKHCELCKTSFRFTKLYDPKMPSTVPLPVFFRQAAFHIFSNLLTWFRWNLVIFVWFGWVPWCMRTVWRGLFWIGDGGWANWEDLERQSSLKLKENLEKLAARGTTPASNGLLTSSNETALNLISRVSGAFPPLWPPVSQTLNHSSSEPTLLRLGKRMLKGIFYEFTLSNKISNSSTPMNTTDLYSPGQRPPSLLSDFEFLQTLTRWRTFNNLMLDVLEGLLITLFVVVAFILVFLIREWVVQQQPAINMGQAFNAAAAAEGQGDEAVALQPLADEHLDEQQSPGPDPAVRQNEENELLSAEVATPPLTEGLEALTRQLDPQVESSQGSRTVPNSAELSTANITRKNQSIHPESTGPEHDDDTDMWPEPTRPPERPVILIRDAMARPTAIHRALEEQSLASGPGWPGIALFKDLWTRAEGKPSEVLRIIEAEGRGDELGWIVSVMTKLENGSSHETHDAANADSSDELEEETPGEHKSDASNESWQFIRDPPVRVDHTMASQQMDALGTSRHDEEPSSNATTLDPNIQDTVVGSHYNQRAPSQAESGMRGKGKGREETNYLSPSISFESQTQAQNAFGVTKVKNTDALKQPESGVSTDEVEITDALKRPESGILTDKLEPEIIGDFPDSIGTLRAQDESNGPVDGTPSPETQQPHVIAEKPQVIREVITEWLWGGVNQAGEQGDDQDEDDEHVVRDFANEAPFVPVAQGQLMIEDVNEVPNPAQNNEVLEAAAAAGIDPNDAEAVEDGEDLEGVMELIGMQGPLAGLVQNGMFSAVLISITVFGAIWVPYIAGKLLLVFLANPISFFVKLPLRWLSAAADIVIDLGVCIAACAFFWLDALIRWLVTPIGLVVPFVARINDNRILAVTAWSYAHTAGGRLMRILMSTGDSFTDTDVPIFSIVAHESLKNIQLRLYSIGRTMVAILWTLLSNNDEANPSYNGAWTNILLTALISFKDYSVSLAKGFAALVVATPSIFKVNSLYLNLEIAQRTTPLDYSLVYWSTWDRVFAVLLGYLLFSIAGATYLRAKTAFSDNREDEKAEGQVADLLYQAGGVMKVILIISIEMILFPLYCGLLLDAALLPLFEKASAVSRIQFMVNSPSTSLFVHWFIGTCYMFHFALFVSMCRKILRSGVLYFIRDPDDPTFHPVRDVLERNVSTQLRKIAFSALVYGALVIVCLGSVVWGLSFALKEVFPIHWSSNEPVLEFPVDLLVYNFIMPVAIRFLRPSVGLNRMYDWWFRRCARALRLSHFLFGEQKDDEEGRYVYSNWRKMLSRKREDVTERLVESNEGDMTASFRADNPNSHFIHDGRYVRAPASDQVRIPKGVHTFVQVDEQGQRVDGLPDNDHGLHGRQNEMFTRVYIPPFFRLRVSAFILLMWLFAATTGVGICIVPLLFGRSVFAHLIPNHPRMNDIYAFSIGINLLGAPLYLLLRYRARLATLFHSLRQIPSSYPPVLPILRRFVHYTLLTLRLTYFYTAIFLLLPSLFALFMECYLLIPLHTYFEPSLTTLPPTHTIHFVQDWTLGVLYVKVAARLILWYEHTRPALALRALVAHGWLQPDVRLATRAFIFPVTVLTVVALTAPLGLGWVANTLLGAKEDGFRACVYRYSYPAVLGVVLGFWLVIELMRLVRGWRSRIRDEVYLIGERLHNFGESRGKDAAAGSLGSRVTVRV